ncbi:O-antigen ligase family protein [Actinomyces sp. MRS3W]|uniref:O-antigen ligase family protein n=1 Tax=Actinomyces sp. MRS3W TaxID=2800796 RepID=UPI0028FD5D96|nr:O-antigen ligase family protein [Actinomyces sp. MRS3W]MDU0349608.1 O-antigen ligase family protein [Actinomyces sp. MRS3W]
MSSTADTAPTALARPRAVPDPAAWASRLGQRCYPLRYLGLAVVCLILMKPILVDQDPLLAPLVKIATAAIFMGLCVAHLVRRPPLSPVFFIFVFYRLAFLPPTLYHGGDLLNWGYASVAQVSLFLLIELQAAAGPDARRRLLRVIADLLLAYLVINYLMILTDTHRTFSMEGQFAQPSYLLGIRTRVTDCIFTATLVSLLYDSTSRRRIGWRTVLAVLNGILQIASLQVATAAVGAGIAILFYVAARVWPSGRGLVSMRGVTVLSVAATLLVVGARIQVHFADVLGHLFGKSVSLTGRTDLWDAAFPILGDSPLFGYGINYRFGAFIPGASGLTWQAHNQYLQLMYDGGLVAVALFLALLWTASTQADHARCSPRVRAAFIAIYAAMSIMMVTEIYTYNMALFYLIPFLASRAGELVGYCDHHGGESR